MEGITCKKCGSISVSLIEYDHTNPQHYDGISEIKCRDCGARFGRFSGRELKDGEWEERPSGLDDRRWRW